jgi:hypothetical protein
MGPIRDLKGVQRVLGCLAALSHFISRLGEKGLSLISIIQHGITHLLAFNDVSHIYSSNLSEPNYIMNKNIKNLLTIFSKQVSPLIGLSYNLPKST